MLLDVIILFVTIAILWFNRAYYKRTVTSFLLIIVPYIVILFFNNYVATYFLFIEIREDTKIMILIGSICFFIGTVISMYFLNEKSGFSHEESDRDLLDLDAIAKYCSFVIAIRILQILFLFARYGLSGLIANDFELMLARGIVGHLLLTVFPFMPLLFYSWLQDKRKINYLVIFALYVVLAFVETEKAQAITVVIGTFIYCVMKNEKKYLKKGLILLLAVVAILFVGNYFTKLTLEGYASDVETIYYRNRLWNYIAGGVINSNYVTGHSNLVDTNALDYLVDVILSLPNMILNGIWGITIGPDVYAELPYISNFPYVTTVTAGYAAQAGNVVSTMTMMWGNGNLFAFIPVCVLWGAVSEAFFINVRRNRSDISLLFFICYMSFSMISFFASYYTAASFTERFIWLGITSWIFNKNHVFTFGRRVLGKRYEK